MRGTSEETCLEFLMNPASLLNMQEDERGMKEVLCLHGSFKKSRKHLPSTFTSFSHASQFSCRLKTRIKLFPLYHEHLFFLSTKDS